MTIRHVSGPASATAKVGLQSAALDAKRWQEKKFFQALRLAAAQRPAQYLEAMQCALLHLAATATPEGAHMMCWLFGEAVGSVIWQAPGAFVTIMSIAFTHCSRLHCRLLEGKGGFGAFHAKPEQHSIAQPPWVAPHSPHGWHRTAPCRTATAWTKPLRSTAASSPCHGG